MNRVLLVEDDPDFSRSTSSYLRKKGFYVDAAEDVNTAYDLMYEKHYDVIVSDIMMPRVSGFEFAEAVRAADPEIPILFVSARDDINAKRQGFGIGIDDYLTKPVDLEELVMRIDALLRRSGIARSKRVEAGDAVMDSQKHTLEIKGKEVKLTARESEILFKLMSNPGKTFTRTQLMEEFWENRDSSSRSVDIYITRIREKISSSDTVEIRTVHGLGYKAVRKDEQEAVIQGHGGALCVAYRVRVPLHHCLLPAFHQFRG